MSTERCGKGQSLLISSLSDEWRDTEEFSIDEDAVPQFEEESEDSCNEILLAVASHYAESKGPRPYNIFRARCNEGRETRPIWYPAS